MDRKNLLLSDACLEASIELAQEAEEKFADAEPFQTSIGFELKMKKLISRMKGGKYHRFNKGVRIAIIAAILLAITLVTVMAVLENKSYEKPYSITVYDRFTNVEFLDERSVRYYETTDYHFTVGYIPVGYEISEEKSDYCYNRYSYENENGHIIEISKSMVSGICSINTEFYPYEEMLINGNWTIIYKEEDNGAIEYNALFCKDGFNYQVYSVLDSAELIKIIKNLE